MKREYVVEAIGDGGLREDAASVDDTESGRKWIKNNGTPGSAYRVVAITQKPVTVKVIETVERRELEEA